jgi:glycosidase
MIRDTLRFAMLASFLAACRMPLDAQFNTPSVDGVIQAGEYGNTQNGTNQIGTNTAQTWYMTWDASNLYVGITNANLSEGAVIYIDANPVNPPNGGTNADGNLAGFNYDGEEVASLPFRAQFVTYFKDGYNEYRKSDGNGNWTGQTSYYGAYASNGNGNVREFAIPWSAISGGLPSSFLFLGLLTSSGGYVYGQVPNDNGGAFIGTSATYTQYFVVNSTANGSSTPPFSIEASSSTVNFTGLYHNTFDPYYRSQEGAAPAGATVTLRLQTAHLGATSVALRVYLFDTGSGNTTGPFDSPMAFYETRTVNGTPYDYYTIDYTTPNTPAIVYYKFVISNGSGTAYYSDDYLDDYDNLNKDGTGVATASEPFDSFQITAYAPNFQTPAWMTDANIYQIFPDRFRNGDTTNDYCVPGSSAGCPSFYGAPSSDDIAVTTWNTQLCDPYNSNLSCYNNFGSIFYGGDLLGIQNELDYIQGLGFDTIYLTPIFEASSNHRYDTDDYLNVDPALGGNAALTSLLAAMNQRGMHAILDAVWNHASSDSTYFNEYNRFATLGACQSLSSPYRTWFHFYDNNVPCTPADYPGWFGYSSLPTFDHTQTAVQDFFYSGGDSSVMKTWYNAGAGGWRFDVASDGNFPHSWWVGTRQYGKSYNPNGPLIGEIWPNASQWLAGDQMDSTMNYRFRRNVTGFVRWPYNWVDDNDNGNDAIIPLTPSQFDIANRAIRDDYPPQATAAMMDLIDSHDTNRALYVMTELGDNGLVQAKQRLELAALFQFTYIGAPMVFYGDEAAINAPSLHNGNNGPVGDPYCRAPYPWTDQSGDPGVYGPPDETVIAYYTALAHLRKQHASLVSGNFVTLLTGDTQQAGTAANTYAYARSLPGETAIVALNNGSSANTPVIPVGAYYANGTVLQDAIGGATYTVNGGNVSLTLNAISGVLLLPAPASADLTPPTESSTLTPAANGNGWNNSSPVTVNMTASDAGSGVSQIRYWVDGGAVSSAAAATATAMVSVEGTHSVGVRVLDNAGNVSQPYTQAVNIDLTAPVVTVTGVTNGATYPYGSVPAAGCSTSDALSGVASNAALTISETNAQGYATDTATCSGAADKAGNSAPPASVTYTVMFTGTAPPSGSACNGSYDGTFNGNITITKNQNCVFIYGGVTGNVTESGGSLSLIKAAVGGNVAVSGGGTFSINVANVGGNLQVQNLPASAVQNQVCGAAVGGDLQYQNNAAGVQVGSGSSACAGNTITGNLQVQKNSGATQLIGNTVHGNLQDNSNTGATQVTGNTIGNNLQCQNNTSITGGGNTAKQKQGQCAAF